MSESYVVTHGPDCDGKLVGAPTRSRTKDGGYCSGYKKGIVTVGYMGHFTTATKVYKYGRVAGSPD